MSPIKMAAMSSSSFSRDGVHRLKRTSIPSPSSPSGSAALPPPVPPLHHSNSLHQQLSSHHPHTQHATQQQQQPYSLYADSYHSSSSRQQSYPTASSPPSSHHSSASSASPQPHVSLSNPSLNPTPSPSFQQQPSLSSFSRRSSAPSLLVNNLLAFSASPASPISPDRYSAWPPSGSSPASSALASAVPSGLHLLKRRSRGNDRGDADDAAASGPPPVSASSSSPSSSSPRHGDRGSSFFSQTAAEMAGESSLFSVGKQLSGLHLSSSPPVLTTVNELASNPRSTSHHSLLSSYPSLPGSAASPSAQQQSSSSHAPLPAASPPLHAAGSRASAHPSLSFRRHSVQDPHFTQSQLVQLQSQLQQHHGRYRSGGGGAVTLPLSRGLVTSSSSGSLRSFSSVLDENDAIVPTQPGRGAGGGGSVGGLLLNEGALHRSSSHSSVVNSPSLSSGSLHPARSHSLLHQSSSSSNLPQHSSASSAASSLSNTPTRSTSPSSSLPRYLGVAHNPARRYSTPVVALSAAQAANLSVHWPDSNAGSSRASPSMLSPPISPAARRPGHPPHSTSTSSSLLSSSGRLWSQSASNLPILMEPESPESPPPPPPPAASSSLLAPVVEQSEKEVAAGSGRYSAAALQVSTNGSVASPSGHSPSVAAAVAASLSAALTADRAAESAETSAILMRRQRTREHMSPVVTPTADAAELLASAFDSSRRSSFSPPAADPRRSSSLPTPDPSSRRHSLAFLHSQLLSLYLLHHSAASLLSPHALQRLQQERCPVCLQSGVEGEKANVTLLSCKDRGCEHVVHTLCLSSPLASCLIVQHPASADLHQPVQLRLLAPAAAAPPAAGGGRLSRRLDCSYELTLLHWMADVAAVKLSSSSSSLPPANGAVAASRNINAVLDAQRGVDSLTIAVSPQSLSFSSSASPSALSAVIPFSHGRLLFSCHCHATKEDWQLHAELDLTRVSSSRGEVQAAAAAADTKRSEYELVYRKGGSGAAAEAELCVVVVAEGDTSGGDGQEQCWRLQSLRFEVTADRAAVEEALAASAPPRAVEAALPTAAAKKAEASKPAPPAAYANGNYAASAAAPRGYQQSVLYPDGLLAPSPPGQSPSPPSPQWDVGPYPQQQSELSYLSMVISNQMQQQQQPRSPLSPHGYLPYPSYSPYFLPLSPSAYSSMMSLSPPPPTPPPVLSSPPPDYAYIVLPNGAIQAIAMTPQLQQSFLFQQQQQQMADMAAASMPLSPIRGAAAGDLYAGAEYRGMRGYSGSPFDSAPPPHHLQQQQQQMMGMGLQQAAGLPTHQAMHSAMQGDGRAAYAGQRYTYAGGQQGGGMAAHHKQQQLRSPSHFQQQAHGHLSQQQHQQQSAPSHPSLPSAHMRSDFSPLTSPSSASSTASPLSPSSSFSPTSASMLSGSSPFSSSGPEPQLVLLAKSQAGSRLLQTKLSSSSSEPGYCQHVLHELLPHLPSLMCDLFGNYAVQKLIEVGGEEDRGRVLGRVLDSFLEVSCDRQGTRAMQKLMECISRQEDRSCVVNALLAPLSSPPASAAAPLSPSSASAGCRLLQLARDSNGSHVVDAILSHFPASMLAPVHAQAFRAVRTLGVDQHGLCILKKSITQSPPSLLIPFALGLSAHLLDYVNNQFGNYLVQHLIAACNGDDHAQYAAVNEALVRAVRGHLVRLSRAKFSSNVVEKLLRLRDPGLVSGVVKELTSEEALSSLQELLGHPYGKFVLQTVLAVAEDEEQARLVAAITPHLPLFKGRIGDKWRSLIKKSAVCS